jgi:hypothetical protein
MTLPEPPTARRSLWFDGPDRPVGGTTHVKAADEGELETRHYIGVTPLGRLHLTAGPHRADAFTHPPTEPLTIDNGVWVYPVSAEIAAEWDLDDEDDMDEGELLHG